MLPELLGSRYVGLDCEGVRVALIESIYHRNQIMVPESFILSDKIKSQ